MNNEQKFTPGPWSVGVDTYLSVDIAEKFGIFESSEAEYQVASVIGDIVELNASANAHLIAAAPTMYEALERAQAYLAARVTGTGGEGETQVLPAIAAALALARGERA